LTSEASDTDEGIRRGRGRERLCAVTRSVRPEAELIRFVAAPDGGVVADLATKLPGRGIWVRLDRDTVAQAVRKNVFARGLKTPLVPASDLADQVARRLRETALGRLGLARKAGAVAAGFAKVEAAVGGTGIEALIIAADAAEDSARKMLQALRRRLSTGGGLPLIRLFSAEELGLALGLPNVIHAAVLQSPAGKSFVGAATRLQRYERIEDVAGVQADDPQDMTNE
jgi:predicted RNA-binding protein YlxR (DUF448 family)